MEILLGAWILTGLFNWSKYMWVIPGYRPAPLLDYILGLPLFIIGGPIANFIRLFNGRGI